MKKQPILAVLVLIVIGGGIYLATTLTRNPGIHRPRQPGSLTFNKDIAPVIFENCSGCHRPGQPSPFPLLTYRDVERRAWQIMEVTRDRYMPPWMPAPGELKFADARHLTADQIGILAQWVEEGAPEGDSPPPPLPVWPQDWQLGSPDLVVTMPEPFTLHAEGTDLYRNFVIPLPIDRTRHVRAVELDPGNAAIVHHAFMLLDPTPQSRRRDEADPAPGFDGIHGSPSAASPEGYFLSWQPGKRPNQPPSGFSWPLKKGTDLVLQLHLQPTGKPETIQPRLAFYFTGEPAQAHPLKIYLSSYNIDIPAGQSGYLVEDSYILPGNVDLHGILPHCHYLGNTLTAIATLPNGKELRLLQIDRWDFNWQGDYRYLEPVFLPKGTRLAMKFVYDNSTNNPANPNHPPQRVKYGLSSTDEMGELWLQLVPRTDTDRAAIARDYQARVIDDSFAYNQYLLNLNPNDAQARSGIGKALYFQGKFGQAAQQLGLAIQLDPELDEPHYYLGLMLRQRNNLPDAIREFSAAIRLNPGHARAHGNLGQVFLQQNNLVAAENAFQSAIQLDPEDALALDSLGVILVQTGRLDEGIGMFRRAIAANPSDPVARNHLEAALQSR